MTSVKAHHQSLEGQLPPDKNASLRFWFDNGHQSPEHSITTQPDPYAQLVIESTGDGDYILTATTIVSETNGGAPHTQAQHEFLLVPGQRLLIEGAPQMNVSLSDRQDTLLVPWHQSSPSRATLFLTRSGVVTLIDDSVFGTYLESRATSAPMPLHLIEPPRAIAISPAANGAFAGSLTLETKDAGWNVTVVGPPDSPHVRAVRHRLPKRSGPTYETPLNSNFPSMRFPNLATFTYDPEPETVTMLDLQGVLRVTPTDVHVGVIKTIRQNGLEL